MRSCFLIISGIVMDGFQTSEMGTGYEVAFSMLFAIFLAMDLYELNNPNK